MQWLILHVFPQTTPLYWSNAKASPQNSLELLSAGLHLSPARLVTFNHSNLVGFYAQLHLVSSHYASHVASS